MIELIFILLLGPGIFELLLLNVGYLISLFRRRAAYAVPKNCLFIVPAHEEEKVLPRLLESLIPYRNNARFVILIDNCEDGTEKIAKERGFETLSRKNPLLRGKPFALQFAFDHLLQGQEDFVMILDADTAFKGVFGSDKENYPEAVQGMYSLQRGSDPLTFFQFLKMVAFNTVRCKARSALGCSSGILGTGWLINKKLLRNLDPSHGLAEDLEMHLQIVLRGKKVEFTESWEVIASVAPHFEAFIEQSHRWETGRFSLVLKGVPALFMSLLRGNWLALEPIFDLLLWPLSIFSIIAFIAFFFTPTLSIFAFSMLFTHCFLSLFEAKVTWKEGVYLLFIPFYLVKKILRMGGLWKKLGWKKTARS